MAGSAESDILYRHWNASSPKAVLLLIHGLGAHTARWNFLAGFFAAKGFSSYALDLRGFGRTPERPRGHIDSFRIYDDDLLALLAIVAREHPGKKIFLLGESLGALMAFNLAGRFPGEFSGQILISPSFKNGMKFPLSSYLTLIALYLINARKTVPVPFTSAMCTRDVAYQKVMDANPDELRVASLKCLMGILGEQRSAKKPAKAMSVPALFLIPGLDQLVDERASRKLFAKMSLDDKTLLEYPDMHHALSIELGREKVFADILAWLRKRV
jgi:alpha-beta hydrolase superfamily lysophospholipase